MLKLFLLDPTNKRTRRRFKGKNRGCGSGRRIDCKGLFWGLGFKSSWDKGKKG